MIDAAVLCSTVRALNPAQKLPCILLASFDKAAQGHAMASALGVQGAISLHWEPALMVAWVIKYLMQTTPLLPDNESKRLQALHSAKILDTPAESVFDDLTRVASIVCQTPIALVSLVDAEKQWFKSRVGLAVTQTPREDSFCAHAVHGSTFLEIRDATRDGRFSHNPLVTGDPLIRFYAGAPLVSSESYVYGTLCVIDRVPRKLTPEQVQVLSALSRVAAHLIEHLRDRSAGRPSSRS